MTPSSSKRRPASWQLYAIGRMCRWYFLRVTGTLNRAAFAPSALRRARPLFHHAHQNQHELENEDDDDGQLQELPARHRRLLDRKPIDVVERFELLLNVAFPSIEAEPIAHQ